MYVGRKHTVTSTTRSVLQFRCVHCGSEAKALVVGVGQGAGNSPYFLEESGAKQRAEASAGGAAEENARLTLRLARCPKCQRRDESALTALKAKAILGALAVVVVFPLVGLGFDALKRSHAGLYIFGPIGLVTAWFIWSQQRWKWETVDNRVAFVGDDEG